MDDPRCVARDMGRAEDALEDGLIDALVDGLTDDALEDGRTDALEDGRNDDALEEGRVDALEGGRVDALDAGRRTVSESLDPEGIMVGKGVLRELSKSLCMQDV